MITTEQMQRELLVHLGDREWRMDNLYQIEDKMGNVVPFVRNDSQREFWHHMWWLNVILKDRQRGFSTLIAIFILDSCLFAPNTTAGIIDITLPDAKKKLGKILFAYDRLPESIKAEVPTLTRAKESIEWVNGSRVDVSTSHRGGTLQILHISEYGKIAARKPDVAKEIKTGAMNTVAAGNFMIVESTAEGQEGEFFEICQESQRQAAAKSILTPLDFKFHFFGWWMGHENELEEGTVAITDEVHAYCNKIEAELGITINNRKRGWYQKKQKQQGDDMMTREFPSTPKEAFAASIDGSYYAKAMLKARQEGRICHVPYDEGFPVEVFWDLGMDDSMSLWFRQRIGGSNRLIDYYEASGEGLAHYAKILNERGYLYGKHYMPHDASVRELGTGIKRSEKAEELGIKPVVTVVRPRDTEAVLDGIEAVRTFLSTCWIDERKCAAGIKCVDNYRKEWDERLASFRRGPLHNWASHGADSLRTGAVALKGETALMPTAEQKKSWRDRLSGGGSINGGLRPRGANVA